MRRWLLAVLVLLVAVAALAQVPTPTFAAKFATLTAPEYDLKLLVVKSLVATNTSTVYKVEVNHTDGQSGTVLIDVKACPVKDGWRRFELVIQKPAPVSEVWVTQMTAGERIKAQ